MNNKYQELLKKLNEQTDKIRDFDANSLHYHMNVMSHLIYINEKLDGQLPNELYNLYWQQLIFVKGMRNSKNLSLYHSDKILAYYSPYKEADQYGDIEGIIKDGKISFKDIKSYIDEYMRSWAKTKNIKEEDNIMLSYYQEENHLKIEMNYNSNIVLEIELSEDGYFKGELIIFVDDNLNCKDIKKIFKRVFNDMLYLITGINNQKEKTDA